MRLLTAINDSQYLYHLWQDIFLTLKTSGGEVMITNAFCTNKYRAEHALSYFASLHLDIIIEMLKIMKRSGIIERVVVQNELSFEGLPWEYRWLEDEDISPNTTLYTYGNKVALHFWKNATIVIVENAQVSKGERQYFEKL